MVPPKVLIWIGRMRPDLGLAVLVVCLVVPSGSQAQDRVHPAPGLFEAVPLDGIDALVLQSATGPEVSMRARTFAVTHHSVSTDPELRTSVFATPTDIAVPHITLRTNDGKFFGGSISAMGNILLLGWGDRALASPDANLGGMFYLNYEDMWGASPGNGGKIVGVTASEDMACYQWKNSLGCVLLNRNATYTGVPLSSDGGIWIEGPELSTRQVDDDTEARYCDDKASSSCFGISVAVDRLAVAVSGSAPDASRYVQVADLVYNESAGKVEWRCLSGCDGHAPGGWRRRADTSEPRDDGRCGPQFGGATCKQDYPWCNQDSGWCGNTEAHRNAQETTKYDWAERAAAWATGNIWSTDASYGDSLALSRRVLAVGAPRGFAGAGYVDMWIAEADGTAHSEGGAGVAPAVLGNARFNKWSRVRVLSEADSMGFGSKIAIKGGIMVVSATGPGGQGSTNLSMVHLYTVVEQTGAVNKLCEYAQPPGDFGASLAIQEGRGNRFTVVVGHPSASRVYAILVAPDEAVKCKMQTLIRQYQNTDVRGDGFGSSIAMAGQFLFVGAPLVQKVDPTGTVISGLLHIMALCTEGNYLRADFYNGCAPCADGFWSAGGQRTSCSSCIPQQSTPLQACDFTCKRGYFGKECLVCSEAMSRDKATKPADSTWVDGKEQCFFRCNDGYERVQGTCIKCPLAAADYNGVWIPETCDWTCANTFFTADAASRQPDCVACSLFKDRQGASKPANSEWIDGLPVCQFGPAVGFSCSGDKCEPCPLLPPHAHWTSLKPTLAPRCDFACDQGFFGHPAYSGVCETCAVFLQVLLPPAQRPSKPARSQWRNGPTCDGAWECVPGTHLSSEHQFCCPDVIANSVPNATVGPCQVRCLDGFWWDEESASCRGCFALPPNAQWGQGNCSIVAKPGYKCTDLVCRPCPSSLPVNAVYVESQTACTYRCTDGYFGHPQFEGICVQCSQLMQKHAINSPYSPSLPAHALWVDGLTCTVDSWACEAGYVRSESDRYCCPQQLDPNAVPYDHGVPCKVSCNPGYHWNNEQAKCVNCPAHPDSAVWTYGCNFKCNAGYFGSELGTCLKCRAFQELKKVAPPPHASWPIDSSQCDDDDWVCDLGYNKKTQGGGVMGCCPAALPEGGVWDAAAVGSCGIHCQPGWRWSSSEVKCVGCPASSYSRAPTSPEWTYDWDREGSCTYKCVHDTRRPQNGFYYAFPQPPARVDECLDCPTFAARMRWHLPQHAQWPGISSVSCENDAWACDAGFLRNDVSGVCCPASAAPPPDVLLYLSSRNRLGQWATAAGAECSWRCGVGYFPTIPLPQHRTMADWNCMTCKDYLQRNGVPSCYSPDDLTEKQSASLQCKEKRLDQLPTECVSSVAVALLVRGLTLNGFTSEVELVLRRGVADVRQDVSVDDVFVTSVKVVGDQRRQTTLAQVTALQVGVEIRSVAPHVASVVRGEVSSQVKKMVSQRLQWSNIAAIADCATRLDVQQKVDMCATELSGGAETWTCVGPKTLNTHTGTCCPKKTFNPSVNMDRYLFDEKGCDWSCRVGFVQTSPGTACLSCAEFNELQRRFKPPNSYWKNNSADCSEWACDDGHVRASSGFSCIALDKLQTACSMFTRCAQCAQDGDCVWCKGACKAGLLRHNAPSCPYTAEGKIGLCDCESDTCSDECKHTHCSACVKDDYCGWCAGTKSCMLGSYFRPQSSECAAGTWISTSGARCGNGDGLWMIGLVCATGSTLLVAGLGGFVVTRMRLQARRQQERAAGRSPEQVQLREQTQRFLSSFPKFRYNGKKLPTPSGPLHESMRPEADERGAAASDADEDAPTCSICLGEFGDGEELRMLPCLHVFHVPCIDQWLAISHECPLCKRSVVNTTNSHLIARAGEFAAAQSSLFSRGDLPPSLEAPPAAWGPSTSLGGGDPGTGPGGAGGEGGGDVAAARNVGRTGRRQRPSGFFERLLLLGGGADGAGGAAAREPAQRSSAAGRPAVIEMVSGITVLSPTGSMLPLGQSSPPSSTGTTTSLPRPSALGTALNPMNPGLWQAEERVSSVDDASRAESAAASNRGGGEIRGGARYVEATSAVGRDEDVVSPFSYPSSDDAAASTQDEEHESRLEQAVQLLGAESLAERGAESAAAPPPPRSVQGEGQVHTNEQPAGTTRVELPAAATRATMQVGAGVTSRPADWRLQRGRAINAECNSAPRGDTGPAPSLSILPSMPIRMSQDPPLERDLAATSRDYGVVAGAVTRSAIAPAEPQVGGSCVLTLQGMQDPSPSESDDDGLEIGV